MMHSVSHRKRVLVVEDDDSHAELIRRGFSELADQYELTVARTLGEALARIDSRSYDVVLTDYMLPDGKGGDLVLRNAGIAPVVMMTSHGNEQVAVEAMKLGALDYVVKMPEVFEAMPRIIERALREWDLMVEHKRAEEALRRQTLLLEQEIAVRKRAQETLRLSEEKFFKAFENAPLIMAITTIEDGTFLEVNKKFLELSGHRREEVLGRTATGIGWVTPEDRGAIVGRLRRDGRVSGVEVTLHAKDGRSIKSEYYGETISVDGCLRLLSIVLDVTERGRLEEQLRHSQKLEAVGLLAGGIAHDFNNILTVIGGYCEMLKLELAPDTPERDKVLQVSAACDRAANLTRSLLAFSRRGEVKASPADLNDIVRGVEQFLQRIIGEDITLSTSLCREPLWAVVDSGQIEQVLVNLVANARDAMPKGGRLCVETKLGEMDAFTQLHGFGMPGRFAQLTVSDSGEGMDESTRTRIFDPFFTTKVAGKGTGLGLAIVYGIVSQHNGFISVLSEPGTGTTFSIFLPAGAVEAAIAPDAPPVPEVARGCETVLVTEDDPHVLDLVSSILREYGYRVITAVNGQETVQKFQAGEPVDLVLMDIMMPVMNGKQASEEIRRLRPDARILFTSGYTADIIHSRGELDAGAELIMKPVRPFDLLRKVREMLDR